MKRIFLLGLLVVAFFVILLIVKYTVGDVRPALSPIPQSTPQQKALPKRAGIGKALPFSLSLPAGLAVGVFADGIAGARDLELSPGGTILVSQPSEGKVIALPDRNRDGEADEVRIVLSGRSRPHGVAFYQNDLFVAEVNRVVRYSWNEQNLQATQEKVLFHLPWQGGHNTRSLAFDKQGRLLVSIGSSCNVCKEQHEWLAAVIVSDRDGSNPHVFAKGLRNAVFMTTHPQTHDVWVTEMGRDFLGDNLPPDEINILSENSDYGWPWCYGKRIYDQQADSQRDHANVCTSSEEPVYEIAAHSAPLGLAFISSPQFQKEWQGDLLVAYHGSWNRSVPTGYKVTRLHMEGGRVMKEEDFITGYLKGSTAVGRPVDLIFDSEGSLYISDDKGGMVYKIVGS